MFDYILIAIILSLLVSSLLIVKVWRKNNYVKELYVDKGVSIVFYVVTIANTIEIITIYFITSTGLPNGWLYLVITLIVDLLLLLVFCISATTCVYLKEDTLFYKNIFYSKKVRINNDTKIIEKFDRKIIKSSKGSISLNGRYLSGSINNLMNQIEEIIKEKTLYGN